MIRHDCERRFCVGFANKTRYWNAISVLGNIAYPIFTSKPPFYECPNIKELHLQTIYHFLQMYFKRDLIFHFFHHQDLIENDV